MGKFVLACGEGRVDAAVAKTLGQAHGEGELQAKLVDTFMVGEDPLRRPVQRDEAVVQHYDAVRKQGIVHIMRDVNHGDAAALERARNALDRLSAVGVEHGRRLIEQQDLRIHGERAGDGDALLLPAGKIRGVCLRQVAHAHGCQGGIDALDNLLTRNAQVFRAKGDVVCDDAGGHLVFWMLEHHGCPRADRHGVSGIQRAFAQNANVSRCGQNQRVEQLDEGGLPRPVAA